MEKAPNDSREGQLVPFKKSLEITKQLFEKRKQELRDILVPDNMPEKDREAVQWGKSAIGFHLKKVPRETLERFWGHGIFRRDEVGNLAAFINILQNHSLQGDVGKLTNSGYYDAATNTDFFILSHADTQLAELSDEAKRVVRRNEIGLRVNVGAFVVNTSFYPIVEDLRSMFPDANIIRADELSEYISKETKERQS